MEKKFSNTLKLLSMAALAMAGAIMSGCGNDDSPADQQSARTVTLTTTISLGGEDGGAQTRALSIDETNHKGVKTFAAGEKIAVIYGNSSEKAVKADDVTLTAEDISADGKTAKITVTLTDPGNCQRLFLIYPAAMAKATIDDDVTFDDADAIDFSRLNAQDGTLESIATGLDLAVYDGSLTEDAKLPGTLTLNNRLAIGEFTIKNSGGNDITNTITGLSVSDGPNTYTITRAAAAGPIFVAMRPVASDQTVTFSATTATTTAYFKKLTGQALAANNMYPANLTMATSKLVNLTTISGNITLEDGDVLTGTLDGTTQNYKISIAAGATVTLSGATIEGKHTNDSECQWAGLTCLGDATIILEGTNAVQNFNRYYPGLQIGPTGTTLTIRGSGSLTATGLNFGAGIGTALNGGSCGDIRIEGGTVTAKGGGKSAGIGSSYKSTCGDITISGSARVTATGGNNGAGIGSADGSNGNSLCGDITIIGPAQVTANGGGNGAGIGTGNGNSHGNSQCGNIRISGSALVTANGGEYGAGIGTGNGGKCGNISIECGNVTAKGGNDATGIGTGIGDVSKKAECGNISITKEEGFVSVTAIRSGSASISIGTPHGENNEFYKCGIITFDGNMIFNGNENDNYGEPDETYYGRLSLTKTTTDNDGDTWTLKP